MIPFSINLRTFSWIISKLPYVYISLINNAFNIRKQINIYEDRLRKADSTEELAWLYHELSRFHCEMKQFELARVYARKCIQMAEEVSNNKWIINARMLITRVNMLQHNKNDAKTEIYNAIDVAKNRIHDIDLEEFLIKVCVYVIYAELQKLICVYSV